MTLNISVTLDNSSDTLTGITNQGSMGYYSGTPGGGSYTVKYYPPLQLSQSARGTLNVSSSLPNSTMGTAIVDVSPGGGGGASNAICKPQGSENQLSGAWTFLLKGLSTVNQAQQGTSRLAIAASFVADGKGGITSGIADYASTAKGGSLQSFTVNPSSSSGSSYSLDSTGHGCLALVVSSGGTMASRTFNIVMAGYSNGVPTSGQIMEFDAANYQELSTGFIMPGNSGSVSNASLNGSFTFGLGGISTLGGDRFANVGGNITFDGQGGVNTANSGLGDANDQGNLDTAVQIGKGSYSLAANGRGTISFTVGRFPINGAIYLGKNGGFNILALSTSQVSTLTFVMSGDASPFHGLLTNTAISGYQLVATNATMAVFNFTPVGGLTCSWWTGSSASTACPNSYTITDPAHGRVTFSGGPWPPPPEMNLAYMTGSTNGTNGYVLGTGWGAETGEVVFQSATPTNYSAGDFTNVSAALTEINDSGGSGFPIVYITRIGRITFDGAGSFSGSYDENGPKGLTTNNPISGPYTMNPDGSGTIGGNFLSNEYHLELVHGSKRS